MAIVKYVNSGQAGADGHTGDDPVNQPWRTIQNGVDWFRDNKPPNEEGILNIVGSFEENVSMVGRKYSNITIQTETLGGYDPTIIAQYCEVRAQIGGDGARNLRRFGNVFRIKDAEGVTLRNLTLLLADRGVDADHVSRLKLDNCCIHDHRSNEAGAGIRLHTCDRFVMLQCRIWGNTADHDGGGASLWRCDDAEITGSLFFLNISKKDGGALFLGRCDAVTIAGCTIGLPPGPKTISHIGPNRAKNGGGIAISQCTDVMLKSGSGPIGSSTVDNTISSNIAQENGGGVSMDPDNDRCTVEIQERNDIVGNVAGESGGGIAANASENAANPSVLEVERSLLHGNSAKEGSGGAVFATDFECSFRDCHIFENHARQSGGAIAVFGNAGGASLAISGACELDKNRARNGGAVFAQTCPASIEDANIHDNVAETSGGGVHLDVEGLVIHDIERTTFTHNRAAKSGGGLFVGDTATIYQCRFELNEAANGAGIEMIDRFDLDLEQCTFKSNAATNQGGGCHLRALDGKLVDGNSFVENSAVEGGAIAIEDCTASAMPVTNNSFDKNVATPAGVDAADVFVEGSVGYTKTDLVNDNTFTGTPSVTVK